MPDQAHDADFMQLALDLAAQAAAAGEVPVGAVVVKDGQVIGRGRNSPIASADPCAHAEVHALREAGVTLGNYRLDGCTLYATLEPCAMCSGAILHARIQRLVFGAADSKTGCAGSVLNLFQSKQLNHQTAVEGGLLATQATAQLQSFFQEKRALQRLQSVPLREDALRTPDACFAQLPNYPWPSHYVSDCAVLNGLRMHFLDEGPEDAVRVLLCLHPIPGWAVAWNEYMPQWLEEGARVIAPDLIGFGRSDKPKRASLYTPAFHLQSLRQLLQHLGIGRVSLVYPASELPVLRYLVDGLRDVVHERTEIVLHPPAKGTAARQAWDAPYPDAGHRAAERALLAHHDADR